MEYLGLLFEFLFLAIAVYLYLFATGKIKSKDATLQAKADRFRKDNGRWLKIMALAVMAIMTLNLTIHIAQILK